MAGLRYTENDEWINVEGDTGTVGITNYAQEQLGDIVYVELPEAGKSFKKGEEVGVVESVKAAAEIYAPVSGEIVEANSALPDGPGVVNSDPTGAAWFYKIKVADASELEQLMDDDKYKKYRELG